MRTLIEQSKIQFTAGTRLITVLGKVFSRLQLRLLVNETQKVLLTNTLDKDLVAVSDNGTDTTIAYDNSLPALVAGDVLAIDVDDTLEISGGGAEPVYDSIVITAHKSLIQFYCQKRGLIDSASLTNGSLQSIYKNDVLVSIPFQVEYGDKVNIQIAGATLPSTVIVKNKLQEQSFALTVNNGTQAEQIFNNPGTGIYISGLNKYFHLSTKALSIYNEDGSAYIPTSFTDLFIAATYYQTKRIAKKGNILFAGVRHSNNAESAWYLGIFDMNSKTLVTTVSVGYPATCIVYNQYTDEIYVNYFLYTAAQIKVYDASTYALKRSKTGIFSVMSMCLIYDSDNSINKIYFIDRTTLYSLDCVTNTLSSAIYSLPGALVGWDMLYNSVNKLLYISSDYGLSVFNPVTGAEVAKISTSPFNLFGIVIVDGFLYAVSSSGAVLKISCTSHQVVASYALPGPARNIEYNPISNCLCVYGVPTDNNITNHKITNIYL